MLPGRTEGRAVDLPPYLRFHRIDAPIVPHRLRQVLVGVSVGDPGALVRLVQDNPYYLLASGDSRV